MTAATAMLQPREGESEELWGNSCQQRETTTTTITITTTMVGLWAGRWTEGQPRQQLW